ncbi:MAG TPA: hypothetical protein VHD31_02465 [Candidatus Paceibacterota bacterium]|nr:hypothetical protein [Candidatus Paceibacterota bacterium]
MNLTASIAIAISAAFNVTPAQLPPAPMPQAQTVEEYVRSYFSDTPILAEIASCESQFRQFGKDGQVVRNPTSSAVGLFQIMSSIHSSFADEKLGLDINTLQGNAAYARYLYQKEGTKPWNASKACWSKSQAYQDLKSAQSPLAINK